MKVQYLQMRIVFVNAGTDSDKDGSPFGLLISPFQER